jgi:hypothetical protein
LVAKLTAALEDPNASRRKIVSACRAIIAASNANLDAIKTTVAIDPDTYNPHCVRLNAERASKDADIEAILNRVTSIRMGPSEKGEGT